MKDKNKSVRLETIRNGLKEVGGVTALARHLNVSRRWIYDVLGGAGTSERVLSAAETIIAQGRELKRQNKSINPYCYERKRDHFGKLQRLAAPHRR